MRAMLLPRLLRASSLTCLALACVGAPGCVTDGEDVDVSEDEVRWEPVSAVMGNPPNFAQLGNGSTMTVVGRNEGRGGKAGALVELFYPHYGTENLWDSYVGVRTRGKKLTWAHDLDGPVEQKVTPDTGLVTSTFRTEGLVMRVEDVLRPGHDAHLRRVVVTNTGAAPVADVDVAFYAFYTLNDLPGGDRLRYDATEGALLQIDEGTRTVSVATMADRAPLAVHCGNALQPLGDRRDARAAAQAGKLRGCSSPLEAGLAGVNGALLHRLGNLAPGASASITYAIGLGDAEAAALGEAKAAIQAGFDAAAGEDGARWQDALGRAKIPAALPAEARDVYRRALITILQHQVDNGAFIAAPTLTSPGYRFIWPRDGSKTAVDALDAGFVPEAKRFFELLETLLLPDGSFAVNYWPDARGAFWDFGKDKNENDQPGMLPWGVSRVFDATGDHAWLAARYPSVRKVAEHLVANREGGLVRPSRDLWELETGSSWTYANASALAGLEASSRIATELGDAANAARWSQVATELRAVMEQRLVAAGGYFGRGVKNGKVDERLEIANLALGAGGFGVYADTDPRVAGVGDLVAQRLLTSKNGVKRYEGDRYYGGQPWPVAAAWLAKHRLARGDRAGAEGLFTAMTDQARTTESHMLGEQFDEADRVWLSAMPLVWSEAAYVRLAAALYGP